MSRISCTPGLIVVPNCSTRAAVRRAASVLRGAFSRRLIVDCEASGAPLPDNGKPQEQQTASRGLYSTASRGAFPPINVFQQGEDFLAIIELPGIDKNDLQIQAKENTIRISGKKVIT